MIKSSGIGGIYTTAIYIGVGATWLISAYFAINERGFSLSDIRARLLGTDLTLKSKRTSKRSDGIFIKPLASVGASCNTMEEATELLQSLLPTIQSNLDDIYKTTIGNGVEIINKINPEGELQGNFETIMLYAFEQLKTPDPDEDQWL